MRLYLVAVDGIIPVTRKLVMVTLSWYALTCEANSDETGHFEKKSGHMWEFQDSNEISGISGHILKFQEFQEFQDRAQAWRWFHNRGPNYSQLFHDKSSVQLMSERNANQSCDDCGTKADLTARTTRSTLATEAHHAVIRASVRDIWASYKQWQTSHVRNMHTKAAIKEQKY